MSEVIDLVARRAPYMNETFLGELMIDIRSGNTDLFDEQVAAVEKQVMLLGVTEVVARAVSITNSDGC